MLTQGTFRYLQETGGGRNCELKGDDGEVLEGAATAVLASASPQCYRSAAGGLLQDSSARTDKDAGAEVGPSLAPSGGVQIGGPEDADGDKGVGDEVVGRKRSGGRRGAAFSRETSRKIDEGRQPLTTQEGTACASSAASERAPSGSEDPIHESAARPAAAQRGGQIGGESLEESAGAASKSEKAESCSVAGGHCEAGSAMAVDAEFDNASAGAPVGKGCGWVTTAPGMSRVPAPLTCCVNASAPIAHALLQCPHRTRTTTARASLTDAVLSGPEGAGELCSEGAGELCWVYDRHRKPQCSALKGSRQRALRSVLSSIAICRSDKSGLVQREARL